MVLSSSVKRSIQRRAGINYSRLLIEMPQPGEGAGFHHYQMKIAHAGKRARYSKEKIFEDIRNRVNGKREVLDDEILQAIEAIFEGNAEANFNRDRDVQRIVAYGSRIKKIPVKESLEQRIVNLEAYLDGDRISPLEVLKKSPVPIPHSKREHAILLLKTLFGPRELIFVGERVEKGVKGTTIFDRDEWIRRFKSKESNIPELLISNPISPLGGSCKNGKPSYRSDNSVALHRYCIVEFDSVAPEMQLAFFMKCSLPIAAITFSGSKSFHAWISLRNECNSNRADDWERYVKNQLKPYFVKYGADPTTFNPSRLTRMPGHYRAEKGRWQELIYLSGVSS